ncbi:radial spoke head 1 homolog [Centruroides vittatus]|uniref:radial spoke head 1 homolog n=1 Tax=Centruroides vittatus TaxID=120091 RepID=UPI00350F5594
MEESRVEGESDKSYSTESLESLEYDEMNEMESEEDEFIFTESDEFIFTEEDIEKEIPFCELKNYFGERNDKGERHGFGKAIYPNGDVYEGCYSYNRKHGDGRYIYHNGAEYKGTWRDGEKDGSGTLRYPDKSVYNGQFYRNNRHGSGHYYYTNGDVYIGEWQYDLRHGYGSYRYSRTGAQFLGNWIKDRMSGSGELIMGNFIFVGIFKDCQPVKGRFLFESKTEQYGEFISKKDRKSDLVWKGGKVQKAALKGGIADIVKFDEKEYLLAAEKEDDTLEPTVSVDALPTKKSIIDRDLKEENTERFSTNISQAENITGLTEEEETPK